MYKVAPASELTLQLGAKLPELTLAGDPNNIAGGAAPVGASGSALAGAINAGATLT